ncbi:TrkA C-terminal domain-containing protein [Helicobacter pametensis]|uniref:TrkA C-terminal domain-containing protein n=1 Tax=Helicobacter pametensis TaxID=95149 RepID=UPI000480311C|nr:TrkA C-terminal domain-containing protein [Helicobacter pametensis]
MKQIALILEGECAKIFLEKLLHQYHSSNFYTIITLDASLIPHTYPNHFSFHHFDPTSTPRLQEVFVSQPDSLFLVHNDPKECKLIHSALRKIFPEIPLILHSTHTLEIDDPHLEEVSALSLASNKLLTHLPNIPTPIQDVGIGKGEIMEILVPSGSVYCYRTLGSISQKEWKIAGIYRDDEFLLSSYSLSIRPNDRILAIGNPKILNNVYRQITSSLGQFPIPFGKDLFLYLDEDLLDEVEILQDIDEALFLHKHLNNAQLMITILNPRRFDLLEHIKSIQNTSINVQIDYQSLSLSEILNLHRKKRIGLAILNHKLFSSMDVKKTLLEFSIPTFKTAKHKLQECSSSLILLEEDPHIASITLDIASQLNLDFEIYDFDVDGHYHTECFDTYKNLSQIFAKPIHLTQSQSKNPIIYLLELQKPILQFLPLDPAISNHTLSGIASTHLTYHSIHLDKNPQILIPMSYENH